MQNNFSSSLKQLRKERKALQKDLSEILGVSINQIQKYEYGQQEPKLDSLIALADYFEVSLDTLVGRKTDTKNIGFDEQKLLKNYDDLNLSGKERLLQYSNDLVCSGNYKKTTSEADLA